jgi:hypothetical protein
MGVLICSVVVVDPEVTLAFHSETHARVLRERGVHLVIELIMLHASAETLCEHGRGSRCRWRR